MSATAGLQVPSGLITSISGGGLVSGTTLPLYSYPIPVVIVGANGASASGNHSITDTSGVLNVSIASGVAVSISGDVILVVSGGTIQVSGSVTIASGMVSGILGRTQSALWNSAYTVVADVSPAGGDGISNVANGGAYLSVVPFTYVYDGTSWNRLRSVDAVSGGTKSGIGINATMMMAFDYSGARYVPLGVSNSGDTDIAVDVSGDTVTVVTSGINAITITGSGGVSPSVALWGTADANAPGQLMSVGANQFIFNGGSWDRVRSLPGSSGITTGLLATQVVGYSYKNLTGAALTNLFSGAAYLHALNINAYSSGGQVQLRDATSGAAGTIIATFNPDVGSVTNVGLPPATLLYDALVTSGIVITTSGTNWDLTILYRAA